MAFDLNYFDSIAPETVRGKFYRKAEIDALLNEIAARTELQNKEQELLQIKLEKAARDLKEIDESGDRARTLAQGILEDANELSAKITSDAQEKADIILEKAAESARQIVEAAEERSRAFIDEEKAKKNAFLDAVNAAWREFAGIPDYDDDMPEDIGDKLDAIAQVLGEIGAEEPEDYPEE